MVPRKSRNSELEQYTYALDMWSLGCLVHELLTSQTPFRELPHEPSAVESGCTASQLEIDMGSFYDYCQGRTTFPTETLRASLVAKPGIDFVERLLVADPDQRATVADALLDPWLANTEYISRWYSNLQSECSDLGLALDFGSRDDKTLMRRIRTTDIAEYIPQSTTESLTDLLGRALEKGHSSIASILIGSPIRRVGDASGEGLEALFQRAIEGRHTSWMKLLLSGERDVNLALCNGSTPLELAVTQGDAEVVKVLLNHNADANANPSKENDPRVLQIAVEKGYTKIVRELLGSGADVHAWVGSGPLLLTAVDSSYVEIVELLLGGGANVNAGQNGRTPLQTAAKRGHFDLVKLLLDNNGEVNSPPSERNGLTALQGAACGGYTAIVELLLVHKADVNAKPSPEGWTALQGAARGGYITIVKLLLENQAEVNAKPSRSGGTALQEAVEQGDIAIVNRLLRAGADPNAPPSKRNGQAALQTAVELGSVDMVRLLLEYHASVGARSSRVGNRTILEIATGRNYTAIANLLSDRIADADAKDMVRFGLYADIMLSVIALSERTWPINIEPSQVELEIAPLLWSIPNTGRKLLEYVKSRSFVEIPWMVVVGKHLFDHVIALWKSHTKSPTQLEPTDWAVITQRTVIKTLVSLLLTEGADVLPRPSKFSDWQLFIIEPCLVFWARSLFFHDGPLGPLRSCGPVTVMIIRLMFINPNRKSFKDTGLMASLAGPVAESVIGLLIPDLGVAHMFPTAVRERAFQQTIHLGYRLFQRTMATRRIMHARSETGKNSI